MNKLKNVFFGVFFVMFAQGCATVGAISDGVQQGVAGTVDVVLGTTSNVVTTVVDEGSRIGQAGAELVVGVGFGVLVNVGVTVGVKDGVGVGLGAGPLLVGVGVAVGCNALGQLLLK